jgi:hypothetical protein
MDAAAAIRAVVRPGAILKPGELTLWRFAFDVVYAMLAIEIYESIFSIFQYVSYVHTREHLRAGDHVPPKTSGAVLSGPELH